MVLLWVSTTWIITCHSSRVNIFLHLSIQGLPGDHQLTNAALAIELCRVWLQRCHNIRISEQNPPKEFMKGLQSAHCPGRGHIVKDQRYPKIIWFLDGAHTAESVKVWC